MSIVAPYVSEVMLLKYMLNHTAPSDVKLHLYKDRATAPSNSDVLSTYATNEVDDSSYAAVSLTGTDWTISTTNGVTSAVYATQTFTFADAVSVMGLYVTDDANAELLWVEKFDNGPFNIPSGGGEIEIDPTIQLQ